MSLFAGEVLSEVCGSPCLYRYFPAPLSTNENKPLVVFIPGRAHLGRIAYGGHKGCRHENFLAHWLNQDGFDFLAISYPLEVESGVIKPLSGSTGFGIKDWGRQAATATKTVIDANDIPTNEVILLAWSMGGRVIVPITKTAKDLGLQIPLAIPLAASPGLWGLPISHSGRQNTQCTEAGYAEVTLLRSMFIPQLQTQDAI